MTHRFLCSQDTIEKTVNKLKELGLVSDRAAFNCEADNNLRSEVAYRDLDFLDTLGQIADGEAIIDALSYLKKLKIISSSSKYVSQAFQSFHKVIKKRFKVPYTTITPVMEHLLFMLSSQKKPDIMVVMGIYCGNTLIWNAGPSCGEDRIYSARKIYGIEIEPDHIQKARDNLKNLTLIDHIDLICEDGCKFAQQFSEQCDYLYLDADNKEVGKGLYLEILKNMYDKLVPGAWVLAHDTTYPLAGFPDQLEEYLSFVRDKNHFQESICFDVDFFGLELSIK